jgi:hypothetical protein
MSKWADEVKRKIDSFNSRMKEIDDPLKKLIEELKSQPYNLYAKCVLEDKQNLVWIVAIGTQTFTISEEEISAKQVIEDIDENNNEVDSGKRRTVKEALEDLIIEKLKSF